MMMQNDWFILESRTIKFTSNYYRYRLRRKNWAAICTILNIYTHTRSLYDYKQQLTILCAFSTEIFSYSLINFCFVFLYICNVVNSISYHIRRVHLISILLSIFFSFIHKFFMSTNSLSTSLLNIFLENLC